MKSLQQGSLFIQVVGASYFLVIYYTFLEVITRKILRLHFLTTRKLHCDNDLSQQIWNKRMYLFMVFNMIHNDSADDIKGTKALYYMYHDST